MKEDILFYDSPVDTNPRNIEAWNHALPIGNGSLGGMVFGGIEKERIQLNEETLWYGGGGRNRTNPDARTYIPEIRRLLKEGNIKEAQRLGRLSMVAGPEGERIYSTAGDMFLEFEEEESKVCNYRRSLDLNEAITHVSYDIEDTHFTRETFCSSVHKVLVMRIKVNKEKRLHFITGFSRDKQLDENKAVSYNTIQMTGQMGGKGGVDFCLAAKIVESDGKIYTIGNRIILEEASEATLLLTIRTSFYGDDPVAWCEETLKEAEKYNYSTLKSEHIRDYQKYYKRLSIDLTVDTKFSSIPTDRRLDSIKNGGVDLGLVELYFNFGRYLLISCSRDGGQPANLQGIWNRDFNPPWGSKYTININTEMNYWLAETCNLPECHMPLFHLLKRMLPNGRMVAKDMYGCSGFVAHHNTDIWGDCAPQDIYMPATIWPTGAAWLCTHIWEHYMFTLDKEFLNEYFPIMKEAAEFFSEYMFEDEKGQLVTGPSVSPENTYIHPSGEKGTLCIGPSMDSQIIIDLYTQCIEASDVLGKRDRLIEKLEEQLLKIPKPSIGKYGQIMEWEYDYEEEDLGHRHISHLYALHPSNQINDVDTPELMKGARVTLERRLANGGGHTGWSRAWIINMWARLKEGEKAFKDLQALLAKSTSSNLFDMHPPFQIDGNFGAVAGMIEMLIQSHTDTIELLPALPKAWNKGSICGVKARGNFLIDFSWDTGCITECILYSIKGRNCIIKMPNKVMYEVIEGDIHVEESQGNFIINGSGAEYKIRFSI